MAGNFPVMNDIEKEREMREFVFKKGYPSYNRLASFYHRKGARNVIEVGKESKSRRSPVDNVD